MVPRAHRCYHPKQHLDRFSRFCMDPKRYAVPYFVNGFLKKTKNCPFTLGFCHPDEVGPSHGDRQHAQKMHMWFGRYARGQTETHTLQYFTTTSMGKVISNNDQH